MTRSKLSLLGREMLLREAKEARLLPVLDERAREVADATDLTVRVGTSFNDAFVLRAYVETGRTDDTEVAFTVDLQDRGCVVTIESRICRDDGLWWSKDNAGHGGSSWKVFEETGDGLKWKARSRSNDVAGRMVHRRSEPPPVARQRPARGSTS